MVCMLGPPGQSGSGSIITGLLYAVAALRDRISGLLETIAEVVFEPAILFFVVLPTVVVATIGGFVAALVIWDVSPFIVVVADSGSTGPGAYRLTVD